jgi:membrane protein DedA with SNARE-associated domain
MHNFTEFLTRHGYAALFFAVLVEQLGLPVPAAPFLVGAGALAALHQLSFPVALGSALMASLLSDWTWFYLGKRRGSSIVRWIAKVCRKPAACTAEMQSGQHRSSARSILISKFVPGLNTLTPSLAGMFGLPAGRFFLLDSAAALLWAVAYMSVGWVFREQLERVGIILERFGVVMGALVGVVLAVYGVKYWRRGHKQNLAVRSREVLGIRAWLPDQPNATAGFRAFPSEAGVWFASSLTGPARRWDLPRPSWSPRAPPGSWPAAAPALTSDLGSALREGF